MLKNFSRQSASPAARDDGASSVIGSIHINRDSKLRDCNPDEAVSTPAPKTHQSPGLRYAQTFNLYW